jgi:excisionase family DNA binding protein
MRKRCQTNVAIQPMLLTIPQVAACLGLGRSKVYELMAVEGLPFIKLGSATRVSVVSLQKWVEQREKRQRSA